MPRHCGGEQNSCSLGPVLSLRLRPIVILVTILVELPDDAEIRLFYTLEVTERYPGFHL